MISFVKKIDMQPIAPQVEDNRFEQIRKAAKEAESESSSDTPGTSVGYCMARNSPAWARFHAGSERRSTPSRVTEPSSTS